MYIKEAKHFLNYLKMEFPLNKIQIKAEFKKSPWVPSFKTPLRSVAGSCNLTDTKATIRIACDRNLYSVLKATAHEYHHVMQKEKYKSSFSDIPHNQLESEAIGFARTWAQTYLTQIGIDWRNLVR